MGGKLNKGGRVRLFTFFVFLFVFLFVFVLATPPTWIGSDVNYSFLEDSVYYHDLRNNITGFNNDVTFAINTLQTNITWTNGSGTFDVSESSVSGWIRIYNPVSGNLTINATHDNSTGFFVIPIEAKNTTDDTASTDIFEFMVNATNDAPNFTILENEYNLSENNLFNDYFNASDEEFHFPLWFNLTFIDNCTHASWSGRNVGENCSIFNLTNSSDTSALMNFTPSRDDVGEYWAWASVKDFGENYGCPHAYCDNVTYSVNKTSSVYIVRFNIFSSLLVNATNCTGQVLTEGVLFSCQINVTTRGKDDTFNFSSYASFKTYGGPVSNRSWFYSNSTNNASNFSKTINISFVPTKRDVGNWSINLSAVDENSSLDSDLIDIFVNWTEDNVSLNQIADYSLYKNETFTVNAIDGDLWIQDKDVKNEVLSFISNTSWVTIESTQTIFGNNYTTATVKINYDFIKGAGNANYSVKLNVTDTGGSLSERIFVVEILNDTKAEWNLSKSNVSVSNESDSVYINLTDGYVFDPDGDSIIFSYSNDTSFDSFNLTSDGIINFTSSDVDVGQHIVTINASDGKLDSFRSFNFTIYNVLDLPSINPLSPTITAVEGNSTEITLNVYDDDFLIPDSQKSFYNESLDINLTFTNLTAVVTKISFTFNLSIRSGNLSTYIANFTPDGVNVGEYNVTVNVTDGGNLSDVEYFILNITGSNDAPNMSSVANQTKTIGELFYLDINATDEEDSPTLPENGNLTFSLNNLTVGGDFLGINSTSGEINLSLNSSYVGFWEYNVSVNDTGGATDSKIFSLTVYGNPNITFPSSGYMFNWSEGNATGDINFSVDYGVNNTILVYRIYMDKIYYLNSTAYNYTTLISSGSLRNETNHTWLSNSNFTWNYSLNYTEETYGMLKNLTLVVYHPDYPLLNDSVNWAVNISHSNHPVAFKGTDIPDKGPIYASTSITINLSKYFEDEDYWDKKTAQTVNFTISTVSGSGFIKAASSISNWIFTVTSPVATTEVIQVLANEYNSSNQSIGNASSNTFQVEFITPPTVSTPSSGGGSGGSSVKLQHFSLKLIVPQEVIVLDEDYIDVGFAVKNSGQVDLSGINLSSLVTYNNLFSSDIGVSLGVDYIPELKIGESKDFTMRILANTQKSGRYRATVFANVSSPKFSDWGDFFIELNKVNESEASQLLVFTEKLVSENPECIELNENLEEAKELFSKEEYERFEEMANKIVKACEDAISANEQIRYPFNFAKENFYYISFSTLVIFFAGFIFYIYKRVRFNKYRVDEYIGGEHV